LLNRELHPVAPLLDSLASALNKVYQIKGVDIRLDISPEVAFIGEKNDFMEVLGNVLDNACKYCLEFVEVRASHCDEGLVVVVDDDGPGIPEARRAGVFERGQRIDTLRPGQGVGLAVVQDVVEQYDGDIHLAESHLGGLSMRILFRRQDGAAAE
jgi:two-component system sensor histidine kinase PhoQ